LFGYLKRKPGGRMFPEFEDLFQAVDEILSEIPRETFDGVFEEWIHKLGECLKRPGEYME
jgi:hypothetical protein